MAVAQSSEAQIARRRTQTHRNLNTRGRENLRSHFTVGSSNQSVKTLEG
jgi:hypothetical protein